MSDVQRQEKMDIPAKEEREGIHRSFAFLFYLGPQQIGLDDATCTGEGGSLHSAD